MRTLELNTKPIYIFLALLIASVGLPFLIVKSLFTGYAFLGLAITSFLLILLFKDYSIGFYILFLFGSILFTIYRLVKVNIPLGVIYDSIIVIMAFSLIIKVKAKGIKFDWKIKEPIVIGFILFYGYFLVLPLVPNYATFATWLGGSRLYLQVVLFYLFTMYFTSIKRVESFSKFTIVLALIVAMHGLYQAIFGYLPFEWAWVTASDNRYNLYNIWGNFRTFSFLSDPSAFGLFMAYTGLFTMVLSMGPFSLKRRVFLLISSLFILVSMSYSGTRTAYAMVVAGVAFLFVLNIDNPRILTGAIVAAIALLIIVEGPFYNATFNRIRSTFKGSEDASMGVRDFKRKSMQPFVHRNPFGGGVNMAPVIGSGVYEEVFDPDGGYLRTAIELGWIGLMLQLLFIGLVMYTAIRNIFELKNMKLRAWCTAFAVPLFAISVAEYAQDAMLIKPVNVVIVATYALMVKFRDLDIELDND
ncbi:MAG: O-antigen ligase family protein [Bacteroidota bacterium]